MAMPAHPFAICPPHANRRRNRALMLPLALAVGLVGCAIDGQPPATATSVTVTAPITIPPGTAHVALQGGRLANAGNDLSPYCELEVRTVSGDEPQRITTGEFRVTRVSQRLLRDPMTRVPAILAPSSCSDPLFQELVWWLSSTEPSDLMYLRCIAPYYNCAFGPPLSPPQIQEQVGRYLTIRTGAAGP